MKPKLAHITMNYTQFFHRVTICLFIFHLITITKTLAQGNFVEGYILTNQNDTIRGLVRDEDWAVSPERIEFKKLNSAALTYAAENIAGFGLVLAKEIYKSKKIGLLDISLTNAYTFTPSFESKDSAQVFLQELVGVGKVTLFELMDRSEHSRFFIEKGGNLKELYYYPFYKSVGDKSFLLVYDEYKRQLARLCGDSERFKEPLPPYREKYLVRYIESYNASFTKDSVRSQAESRQLTFDLELNAGVDSWEGRVKIQNRPTYGFGLRVNFPRKFRNRYIRAAIFFTPGIGASSSSSTWESRTARTIEVGLGRYIGSGRIRPCFGLNASIINRNYRADFLGLHAGMSYNRRISLEIGHFGNFYCILTKSRFFIQPRISLHYFVNLSLKQKRMR